jgi:hypothetical protein
MPLRPVLIFTRFVDAEITKRAHVAKAAGLQTQD